MHRYFIIFPSRKLIKIPSDYELKYEEASFYTKDNTLIYGWFIKGGSIKNWKGFTIIFFQGNKGTMSDFLLQVKPLAEAGFNVLLFGYRGSGKSPRKWPVERGVYADSEAACEFLIKEKGVPLNKIIFLGQSLGCAMASYAAIKLNPLALILEGGFPSIADVAARAVKWLPLRVLTRSRFDTKRYLAEINCPVMIIHSRDDRAIPLSDADILLGAVKGKKKKVVISGPHAKGLEHDSALYLNELEHFLKTAI
ncbi:MAG: alpha/beta hydrolase [Deltaproteobacteria bacterium]|nr:alpha/beta hydrolase [Deltaproteobacteria bacterium]